MAIFWEDSLWRGYEADDEEEDERVEESEEAHDIVRVALILSLINFHCLGVLRTGWIHGGIRQKKYHYWCLDICIWLLEVTLRIVLLQVVTVTGGCQCTMYI